MSPSPGCFGAGQWSRKAEYGRREGGTGQRGQGGQLLSVLVTLPGHPGVAGK